MQKRATPVSTSVRELKGNSQKVMLTYLRVKTANEKFKEQVDKGSKELLVKIIASRCGRYSKYYYLSHTIVRY